ncbi:cytochrome P450 2J2-like isoform X2 [Anguilla anguilla]|uniref:cytochrome P450 2J2-like isoform X2 n=1 Tax=Anguilla anguilla TaxID=7936 RepID=UPI0015A78E69|nr:cytochrome P450 2J2-like isoform X2 [Anguilla anguilla]
MIVYTLLAWLDIKGCLLTCFVILLVADIIRNKNPPNFPPGPWPLPFLGNVFTGVDYKTMDKLAEEYGSVFSLRRGSEKTVFVSGFRTVKEALVNQGQSFTDRPVSPLFDEIYKGHGLSFTNGYVWHKQKQFALAHLKNFGEGRKTLEFHILKECDFLSEVIREEQGNCLWSTGGGPFDPHEKLNNAVANIIGVLVFGRRFEYGDIRFQKLLRMSAESVSLTGSAGAQLYDSYPRLLKYFPGVHQTIISNYGKLANFLREEIDKHVEDWDPSNPRDYIDCYLMEIEKRKNDTEAGFNKENLVFCTVDLFEGGTETTTNTMRWALLFMMKYMNVQKKVQAEIDRVIGQSRQPTLADRGDMPYTDAVIHEIQRMGNIVPLNMARIASKDTTLGGCCLPKGTVVVTNLSSVLNDKNEWETPDTFNPGHFLDSHGRFRRREAFFPFSAGKRVCPGEHLARTELFLIFTYLLQQFTFCPPPGVELSLESQLGFTQSPKPFQICVSNR